MKQGDVKITVSVPSFRRWDMIMINTNGSRQIVTDVIKRNSGTNLTTRNYKIPKNKWLAILKFWWLKVQVHYS